jgi:carboxyl-terminal processing protease
MTRSSSFVAIGVALGVSCALIADVVRAAPPGGSAGLALYRLVFEKALSDYVEAPDPTKMTTSAINGMLASLDPHSNYLDPKSLKDFQTNMKGEEFGGLGLEVMQENGLVRVVSPIDETPAARAGVMAGDMIVRIDATEVKGLSLKEAVDRMRGPAKTHVAITVQRGVTKDTKVFDIVREIIHVQPVRSRVEGGDIGYIRITQFNEQTYDALKAAISKFHAGNAKLRGYVLDLRNNPGGLLSQSIRVVNTFIDQGEIVSTRGRTSDLYQQYDARPGYNLSEGKPVVVLINGGSASASEIVSGALQDLKRATLIGTRSFGKGSVQTVLPLGEDGALKLTTARYYTPSGRSIQAKGIEPDYQVLENIPDDLKGKVESLGEASLQGHLKNGTDEQKGSDAYVPPDPAKDTQLEAAVDFLHGKPPLVKASNDTGP